MITEHDLQEAIAECEGQRNPTANTCIKLAAFYTIKQHLFPDKALETQPMLPQSFAPAQQNDGYVHLDSDSDFAHAIDGLSEDVAWNIIEELMETLSVLNPKLYNSIMRKIETAE